MKLQRAIESILLAGMSVFALSVARAEVSAGTNAPTGLYSSVLDIPERFILQLSTNGDYQVYTTGSPANRQHGRWKWDDKRREFLLTPATNSAAFVYEFRRLRVDPHQPDKLQWIPLHGVYASEGAIDYLRFKRTDAP
jgi:hypothetical protein